MQLSVSSNLISQTYRQTCISKKGQGMFNFQMMLDDMWADVPQEVIDDVLEKLAWVDAHVAHIYAIALAFRLILSLVFHV